MNEDMKIKIKVINFLTGETEIDSETVVESTMEIVKQNHEVFRGAYPDCQVNFTINDGESFIFSPPVNMMLDEVAYKNGQISWEELCQKWYGGCPAGPND